MSSGIRALVITTLAAPIVYRLLRRDAVLRRLTDARESLARRPALVWMLVWAVALVPMIYMSHFVMRYSVNVPLLDDWEMASLIVKQHEGQLTFADLFAQQQEGRTILPKLIFLASAAGGHWDVREQIALSVVTCWLTAAGLFFLLRRSGIGAGAVALCFSATVLLIFSPAQFELWLLASGFPSFLPVLFVVGALCVLKVRAGIGLKFAVCAIAALASSFTLPHGLLAWGLTFPLLLFTAPPPRTIRWAVLWAVLCGACAAVYFHGYAKPGYLPQFAPARGIGDYLRFALIFLGGSFAYASTAHPATAATMWGAVQVIAFSAAVALMLRRMRDQRFRAVVLPWLALCGYAVGSALLAALGRVGYGADYALASRYVPFSLYFAVGVSALVAILLREFHFRAVIRTATAVVLAVLFLATYREAATNTMFFLRAYAANARLARAAVLFCDVVDTRAVLKRLVYPPNENVAIELARALDRHHLLDRSLIRSADLTKFTREPADGRQAAGQLENVGSPYVTGWAALLAKRRQADCILISDSSMPIAMANQLEPRPDIVRRFRDARLYWSGWSADLRPIDIPSNRPLSAWAVDLDAARMFELSTQQ